MSMLNPHTTLASQISSTQNPTSIQKKEYNHYLFTNNTNPSLNGPQMDRLYLHTQSHTCASHEHPHGDGGPSLHPPPGPYPATRNTCTLAPCEPAPSVNPDLHISINACLPNPNLRLTTCMSQSLPKCPQSTSHRSPHTLHYLPPHLRQQHPNRRGAGPSQHPRGGLAMH